MDGKKDSLKCKVVLVGNSGVGKTSIVERYIHDTFDSEILSSCSAQYNEKKIWLEENKKTLRFELWDTAGKEKYRSLAKVFYKEAACFILIYDITRRTSFEDLKKFWIPDIKNNAPPNASKLICLKKIY